MFMAMMETESFEFKAFAETEEASIELLNRAFAQHLEQHRSSLEEWKESLSDYCREGGEVTPAEWYGAHAVGNVLAGNVFRDSEMMDVNKESK